jgi:hypothetical protein
VTTKILLVLRAGAGSLHRSWTHICAGRIDVAMSMYDDSRIEDGAFAVVHRHAGPKFRGLAAFFAANDWVIDAYTHFWLFDDDIFLPFESLLMIQDIVERYQFALCAPSLTPESFMAWPITVQNSAFYLRVCDFVEGMAPIMSRAFLQRALPRFNENHSGWGHEWLWRRDLKAMGALAANLDAAPIVHTRPQGTGTLYFTAGGERIDPFAEWDSLLAKHGIEKDAEPFQNFFGLGRADRRPVYGADFQAKALAGYESLRVHNPAYHQKCMEFLRNAPKPLATLDAIRTMPGGAALMAATAPTSCPIWRCAVRPCHACTRRRKSRAGG